jgi:ubiquinol-cytochrome c reductase iron-sulfur subunit
MDTTLNELDGDATRRDFLTLTASAFAAIGAAGAAWPLIDQMNPDASALSMASVEVDLSPVQVGQAITVLWRGKPVFIRHRTASEIKQAQETPVSDLKDAYAQVMGAPSDLPASDTNRTKAGKENWLVAIGICTHLGCVPKGQGATDDRGLYGGWFCPCHGSMYDTAGRIRQGPAPRNLDIPPYEFIGGAKIRIG